MHTKPALILRPILCAVPTSLVQMRAESCSSVDKVRMLIEFEIRNQLDNRQCTRLMMREIADGNQDPAELQCRILG
jgi:hypothetical protein